MTRPLRVVAASGDVLSALRDALGGGDALFVSVSDDARVDPSPTRASTPLPETVPQRVALVVQTSGSTGIPKRVALSADAVLASAGASESALGGPGQWLLALPTHYIAGLTVLARSIAAGIDPVVDPSLADGGHFTATGFVTATRALDAPARFTSLVPAQLATLLDDAMARAALATFQRVLVGGQATPQALVARAADHGIRITRTYGSSETSGGCVYDGKPIGGARVRVVDGEVQLGGPTIAEGYLGQDELTSQRFMTEVDGRWFRTADAGSWDGERLTVTGRRDDVLVSGGVKVALGEVERVLREQPGFADAVVIAAADERWGQVPVAFTESRVDTDAAIEAVALALGVAARPARVIRLDALPLLPSGKPDRRALTEGVE